MPLNDDDKPADYPSYVRYFKGLVQANNNSKHPKGSDEPCICWVDVPQDYLQWSADDLKTVATSKYFVKAFDTLLTLSQAAIKTNAEVTAYTPDALKAQAALAELAPIGQPGVPPLGANEKVRRLNWEEFQERIVDTYNSNARAVVKARHDGAIWEAELTDDILSGMRVISLNKDILTGFARSPKDAYVFNALYVVAKQSQETNSSGQYTDVALKSQQVLAKYAQSNNWRKLYNVIMEVNRETEALQKGIKTGAVDFKTLKSNSVDASDERLGFNQQDALDLLNKRGVTMSTENQTVADHGLVEQFKKQIATQRAA